MERIWLAQYPPGVPADIDPGAFRSLKHLLETSCERYRSLPAFTNMGTTLSYDELDRHSRGFGAYLQNHLRMRKGERLAIMLPNLLQYPVALFGALRAGLTVVNINPLYTARELQYQLQDSGASAIVVLENFAHTVQEALLERSEVRKVIVTGVGYLLRVPSSYITNFVVKHVKRMVPEWHLDLAVPLETVLRQGRDVALEETDVRPDDIAFLQYTGGTTGVPKGAMLTHGNMVANLEQVRSWIASVLEEGKEIVVTPLPLYHIFSLTANLLTFVSIGARNLLITNPRDLHAFIKELRKYPFTVITGVNTLFNALLNSPE